MSEEVRIVVRPNGPYRVYGPVRFFDADGNEFERPEGEWVVLCRCGESGTKPFCDGTHKRCGFVADDQPAGLHESDGGAAVG